MASRNRKVVPEAKQALDQMKYEIAGELGAPIVNLSFLLTINRISLISSLERSRPMHSKLFFIRFATSFPFIDGKKSLKSTLSR